MNLTGGQGHRSCPNRMRLLLAGFIPGVFSAFVYATLIITLAVVLKTVRPPVSGCTWCARFESLPPALPIVAVVVIIIVFVCNPFGDAGGTPTEGGAVGAVIVSCMALLLCFPWVVLWLPSLA